MKSLIYFTLFIICASALYFIVTVPTQEKEKFLEKIGIQIDLKEEKPTTAHTNQNFLEFREWRNKENQELLAKLVGISLNEVKLLKKDNNQIYNVSIDSLDSNDQQFISDAVIQLNNNEDRLKTLILNFPEKSTKTFHSNSGNILEIDFDGFEEFSRLQSDIERLDILQLEEQLDKIQKRTNSLLEKYTPQNYNNNRRGAEAKLYHKWLLYSFQPYLSEIKQLIL